MKRPELLLTLQRSKQVSVFVLLALKRELRPEVPGGSAGKNLLF